MKKPRILIVGSFTMDLITSTRVFPGGGETVLGTDFSSAPGGKGANQAVQAARLGADVTMVGKLGGDAFGDLILESVRNAGIHTEHILRAPDMPSPIGNIILEIDEAGNSHNRIIVVPATNMTIRPEDVAFLKDEIANYDMVMLQFEIPMEINVLVAQYAHAKGVPVMVNPAPAAEIPESLLQCTSWISPNEHEAAALTGRKIRVDDGLNMEDVEAAASILRSRGVDHVMITLGDHGAALMDEHGLRHLPCVPDVAVADPTSAGDSFVAAFCTGICAGLTPVDAMNFARNAAAITVSRMGAQPSEPTLEEVLNAMHANGNPDFPFSRLDSLR